MKIRILLFIFIIFNNFITFSSNVNESINKIFSQFNVNIIDDGYTEEEKLMLELISLTEFDIISINEYENIADVKINVKAVDILKMQKNFFEEMVNKEGIVISKKETNEILLEYISIMKKNNNMPIKEKIFDFQLIKNDGFWEIEKGNEELFKFLFDILLFDNN